MAENTKIEWTDHTFNPWIGCTKVSAACDHCYAERWEARFGHSWGPHVRRRTSATNWRKPLAWDRAAKAAGKRARVFCASLADVFDNDRSITSGWRGDLWHLIHRTPNLDWLLLTKRPQNIARFLRPEEYGDLPSWGDGWPNVWIGTTVENQQEADRRVPHLLATPAYVRFLSCEPLLGPVNLEEIAIPRPDLRASVIWDALRGWGGAPAKLDLVIVGGESGPGARPMHPDWARSLRDQCGAAGVVFHFKQWGEWEVALDRDRDDPDWRADYSTNYVDRGKSKWLNLKGGCGFHGERFHVMRRVGKKAAGRLLDGIIWDQMPEDVA